MCYRHHCFPLLFISRIWSNSVSPSMHYAWLKSSNTKALHKVGTSNAQKLSSIFPACPCARRLPCNALALEIPERLIQSDTLRRLWEEREKTGYGIVITLAWAMQVVYCMRPPLSVMTRGTTDTLQASRVASRPVRCLRSLCGRVASRRTA